MTDTNREPLVRTVVDGELLNLTRGYPFELENFDRLPAILLLEAERERMSWLPEFSDIFASDLLLMQAEEYSDGDLWSSVLNFIAARNLFRRIYLPDHAPVEPGDQLYAAQFYRLTNPQLASWSDIHAAAKQRELYMKRMEQILEQHPEQAM